MARHKNNRYMGILWVLVFGAIFVFFVVQLSSSVSAAMEGRSVIPVVSGGVGLVIALGIVLHTRRRIERAFLERGPEALLRALRPGGSKLVPNGAAWGAYLDAWALTLYGQFDPARDALARVEWKREPPIVQAAATSVEALLCFFDTKKYARGLKLARAARAAADVSDKFPGAKTALDSYDSLVEIGQALTNKSKADTIANLGSKSRTLPFGARLIATWGLAAAYARSGDQTHAAEALSRCKAMAPYCEPLCSLPEPMRAGPTHSSQKDPELEGSEP